MPQAGSRHAAIEASSVGEPAPRLTPAPRRESPPPLIGARAAYLAKSIASLLFLAAVLVGGLVLWSKKRHLENPAVLAPIIAGQFLSALRDDDYAAAYAMLTPAAAAECNIEEFRRAGGSGWTWSDLRVAQAKPAVAVLAYTRRDGADERRQFVALTREGQGGWLVADDRVLLEQARDAMNRQNADLAVLKAQAAARVNPYDPAARRMLCDAARARALSDVAAAQCDLALELERRYAAAR